MKLNRLPKSKTKSSGLFILGGFDDGFEGFGFVDGQFGQDFAVQSDVSLFEAGDQLGIGGAIQAGGGVDAGVPELPKGALAILAVAGGVLQAFSDGLTAALDAYAVRVAKTLSGLTDLVMLGVGGDAAFDSHKLLLMPILALTKAFFNGIGHGAAAGTEAA